MRRKIHHYEAADITISYERRRCTHALDCIRGQPKVFDMTRRRWIDATQASADDIALTIERCPTGALQYRRKDGKPDEAAPALNEARASALGPINLHGNLEIHSPEEPPAVGTRVALCRCGASGNQPFCDNSHEAAMFQEAGTAQPHLSGAACGAGATTPTGLLRVLPLANGPCFIGGYFTLHDSHGVDLGTCGPITQLCRCGKSKTQPFCDRAHLATGFEAPGLSKEYIQRLLGL